MGIPRHIDKQNNIIKVYGRFCSFDCVYTYLIKEETKR